MQMLFKSGIDPFSHLSALPNESSPNMAGKKNLIFKNYSIIFHTTGFKLYLNAVPHSVHLLNFIFLISLTLVDYLTTLVYHKNMIDDKVKKCQRI